MLKSGIEVLKQRSTAVDDACSRRPRHATVRTAPDRRRCVYAPYIVNGMLERRTINYSQAVGRRPIIDRIDNICRSSCCLQSGCIASQIDVLAWMHSVEKRDRVASVPTPTCLHFSSLYAFARHTAIAVASCRAWEMAATLWLQCGVWTVHFAVATFCTWLQIFIFRPHASAAIREAICRVRHRSAV